MYHHRETIKYAYIEASELFQCIITATYHNKETIKSACIEVSLLLMQCIITEKPSNQLALRLPNLCNVSSQRNRQISLHWGFLTYAMYHHRETIKSACMKGFLTYNASSQRTIKSACIEASWLMQCIITDKPTNQINLLWWKSLELSLGKNTKYLPA